MFDAIHYIFGLNFKTKSKIGYKIYSAMIFPLFQFAYTSFMIVNLFIMDNTKNVIEGTFMCFLEIIAFNNVVNLVRKRAQVRQEIERIESFQLQHEDEERLFHSRLRLFKRVTILYCLMCNAACLGMEIGGIYTTTSEMIYYAWYPVNWQNNRLLYWALIFYQTFGMHFTCFSSTINQMYSAFFLVVISTQLEVICRRIEKIGHYKMTVKGYSKSNNGVITSSALDVKSALVEWIMIHRDIEE